MKKTTEQFAAELKERHNLTLTSEYLGAAKPVTFTCENGHQNSATATNVLQRGYNCKECKHGRKIESKIEWDDQKIEKLKSLLGTMETTNIAKIFNTTDRAIYNVINKFSLDNSRANLTKFNLLKELKNQNRELISDYTTASDLVTIKCSSGHIVEQTAGNILYKGTDCPKCFSALGKSKKESELQEFIEENYTGSIITGDRSMLKGKELDIVLPDLKLAFEYNGSYWHSSAKVDKYYHVNKTNAVEALGFQLIHVYEYNDFEIVKSRILQLLGKSSRIYARNTVVKEISWPKEFLNLNHIQGAGAPTSHNFGLFLNDTLVAVMTFSKPRFTPNYEFELVRYCSKINTSVVGGASKLLKYFNPNSVISYAARDWSTGKLYKQLGFTLSHTTEPGYKYTNHGKVLSRYACQKHKLPNLLGSVFDENLTEEENMRLANWLRIYDSGNLVFTKQRVQ